MHLPLLASSLLTAATFFTGAFAAPAVGARSIAVDHHKAPSEPDVMPLCHGVKVFEATIDEIQKAFASGRLTSVQLVQCYLDRATLINNQTRAIMELNPDALEIAAKRDKERKSGRSFGSMHGIPVLTKDNIATYDKVDTTAGSTILLGSKVPRDAQVVALLRKAGAIPLGHAGMSEWADMRSNDYSEGYSQRGGQVRNVYNLTQNPGGSSSGSAQGVSGNQAMIAYGTETDGSVIAPSSRAGVYGFKPTVGLTSRSGVIPESIHQDTVGAMARSFRDVVIAVDAIAGPDPRDPTTLGIRRPDNYTQYIANKTILAGAKFGIPWTNVWTSPSTVSMLDDLLAAVAVLQAHGATIYNHTDYKYANTTVSPTGWNWDYGPANQSEYTVVKADFYNNIETYLVELSNTTIRTLADIIAANNIAASGEGGFAGTNVGFNDGQGSFIDAQETGGIYDETYYAALAFCQQNSRTDGIDYALHHKLPDGTSIVLDGLLLPSDPSSAVQQIVSQAGYPSIQIPVSVDPYGVPFGIQLVNTAFSEPTLVKYGSAIDDALGRRRVPPSFFDFNATNIPINGNYQLGDLL